MAEELLLKQEDAPTGIILSEVEGPLSPLELEAFLSEMLERLSSSNNWDLQKLYSECLTSNCIASIAIYAERVSGAQPDDYGGYRADAAERVSGAQYPASVILHFYLSLEWLERLRREWKILFDELSYIVDRVDEVLGDDSVILGGSPLESLKVFDGIIGFALSVHASSVSSIVSRIVELREAITGVRPPHDPPDDRSLMMLLDYMVAKAIEDASSSGDPVLTARGLDQVCRELRLRIGLSRSTCYRKLESLSRLGYLVHIRRMGYMLRLDTGYAYTLLYKSSRASWCRLLPYFGEGLKYRVVLGEAPCGSEKAGN